MDVGVVVLGGAAPSQLHDGRTGDAKPMWCAEASFGEHDGSAMSQNAPSAGPLPDALRAPAEEHDGLRDRGASSAGDSRLPHPSGSGWMGSRRAGVAGTALILSCIRTVMTPA